MRSNRLARLHGAVDRQVGEAVILVPFAGGGYLAGAPGPARPILEIVACVTEVPKTVRGAGAGAATGHNAELLTASHTIAFTRSLVPYGLDKGDRVVLLDRACVELEVNAADPFGTDRTIARLQRLPPEVP